MSEEMDDLLDIEPRRPLAAVAPLAFVIGGAMGAILAGFGVFYLTWAMQPAEPGASRGDGRANVLGGWFDGEPTRPRAAGARRRRAPDVAAPSEDGTDPLEASVRELSEVVRRINEDLDRPAGAHTLGAQLDAEPLGGGRDLPPGYARDLDTLRAELAAAEQALAKANATTERLRGEIARLKKAMAKAEARLEGVKEDALYNRWLAFVERARIDVCESYGRGRAERCHATVESALRRPALRMRFAYCLRTGQAEPMVDELPRGEFPPDHAILLDDESRLTRDWMVVFCDKQLPLPGASALAKGE